MYNFLHDFQGHRKRHQEASGRSQRHIGIHSGHLGQAGPGAAHERVREVLQKVLQHPQGILQRGTVSVRPTMCLIL